MASRADDRAAGAGGRRSRAVPPGLGPVVRASFSDYYFHSMRLVPANVVWGAWVVAIVLIGFAWPPGGLLLLPTLVLPSAGIFRVAARIVRAEPGAGLPDVAWPYRGRAGRLMGLGAAIAFAALVLATNVATGIAGGTAVGWVVATLAGWGLVALWCGMLVAWPLIVDPAREATPLRARLRLAAGLLLVDPIRLGVLGVAAAGISILSVILTAAILTVSVSFVALIACRTVYPIAGAVDGVLTPTGSVNENVAP